MLLIGSFAAAKRDIQLKRDPELWGDDYMRDIDLIASFDDAQRFARQCSSVNYLDANHMVMRYSTGDIIEIEIAWPGSSAAALLAVEAKSPNRAFRLLGYSGESFVASTSALYMLKMSHRYKKDSPHFLKTMRDIHTFRRYHDVSITPDLEPIYQQRMKETYHYQHPNLNRSKTEFFTPDVPYVYDHDDIHKVIALYDEPAYRKYMKDDAEVNWDRDKFWALPEEIRLAGVYEETIVLALERSQIPYPNADPYWSFTKALEKVCTSITSGAFREYAWENYDAVLAMYRPDYVTRFHEAVAAGKVGPYRPLSMDSGQT